MRIPLCVSLLLVLFLAQLRIAEAYSQAAAFPAFGAFLQEDVFVPNVLPVLTVSQATGMVSIDGDLDEPVWRSASVAGNFSEVFPGDQTKPPIGIRALITYDEAILYVAFVIDDDPGDVRASLSDRDDIWQDDYVGIVLDPNGDGQALYFIAANPLGIQGDLKISPQGEDEGFNMVFRSAGKITESGYRVEMAIPFKSLRFPAKEVQAWRSTFWITHPRDSRRQYSWAAVSRDDPCWSCQMGTLHGMEGVRSGRNLEILPALTGAGAGQLRDAADGRSPFESDRVRLRPSLNVKYGVTSALTVDATLNPDFSQIESDDAQIDVNTTFALSFDERRPFFQEGSDLFQTDLRTVYTRSINEPTLAAKGTARFGATSLAYIGARDRTSPLLLPFEEESALVSAGHSTSNILRVMHTFAQNRHLGALITDRRIDEGGSGSTVGVDASYRFLKHYTVTGQLVWSHNAEPMGTASSGNIPDLTFGRARYTAALDGEKFWGHGLTAELDRQSRHWGFEVGYEELSPTFRADNGFVRQNNSRRAYLWQGVFIYPSKVLPFVDRIQPMIVLGRRWNFDGVRKSDYVIPMLRMQLKRQTNVSLRFAMESELYKEQQFDGLRRFSLEAYSGFSEPVRLGLSVGLGRDIARLAETPELGASLDWSVFSQIRLGDRLQLQPRLLHSSLKDLDSGEEYYSGYILRSRLGYQFTRRFFFRTIVQYNGFSRSLEIDPLLTYKVNPFTAVYLGSTHDMSSYDRLGDQPSRYFRESSRQLFFKLQYLLRT